MPATSTTRPPANDDWVARLRGSGPQADGAVAELHTLLLRAARFELNRRAASLPEAAREELAQQSADDAVVAVLGKLDDFRGESRFTTWAYKFALYDAAVKARRRAWLGREIPLEPERWRELADPRGATEAAAEARELLAALREAIDRDLTPRQREVLVAVVLLDVPIDVLAERLGTTRGALYKTLHDARRKLRESLRARGLATPEMEEGR
jgi:RNA polymerase sigma-70 factor (ECF subfamily)